MLNTQQQLHPLPYVKDSAKLFSVIAEQPWAVFLDSGYPYDQQGRYDIFAADPVCKLVTRGAETTITGQQNTVISKEDPFLLIKDRLGKHKPGINDLPFNGGAIGYFSYDLGRRLENIPVLADDAESIPDMAVGIYLWAVIIDHKLKKSYLVCPQNQANKQILIEQFSACLTVPMHNNFHVNGDIQSNMSREYYAQAFAKIKTYLKEGDCYQVNLAQRFSAYCQGDLWSAYQMLRKINSAPFSCYINLPDVQILSSSPERFLQVTDGIVETKPIKGTRPRKQDAEADALQAQALADSIKDRAENVMIVDLLRNDISKVCLDGSVKVAKLCAVESFATVHHLVSTISGKLKPGYHALDLLRSCFPGGSITGAPKIRAMEIIEELEPQRRGVYCGSVGYIGLDGNMDTNIAIRTLVHSNNSIRFWAGGGIVNDSDMQAEYQECFDKAAAMLDLLQRMS